MDYFVGVTIDQEKSDIENGIFYAKYVKFYVIEMHNWFQQCKREGMDDNFYEKYLIPKIEMIERIRYNRCRNY